MTMEKDELFFENETRKHQQAVGELMSRFARELLRRASIHDDSKLESPERETFIRVTAKLKGLTYGSDEYKVQLEEMGEALHHHYLHNRHHPEFFDTDPSRNGVGEMTLVDVVEMLCDWYAATKRHADGDIYESIRINRERFRISDQLTDVLRNTVSGFFGEVTR